MKKDFVKCCKHLQNIFLLLQGYDVTVLYNPGKRTYLTDKLWREDIHELADDSDDHIIRETEYIPVQKGGFLNCWQLQRKTEPCKSYSKKGGLTTKYIKIQTLDPISVFVVKELCKMD